MAHALAHAMIEQAIGGFRLMFYGLLRGAHIACYSGYLCASHSHAIAHAMGHTMAHTIAHTIAHAIGYVIGLFV